jgi:hypothetical protein
MEFSADTKSLAEVLSVAPGLSPADADPAGAGRRYNCPNARLGHRNGRRARRRGAQRSDVVLIRKFQ